MPTETSGKGLIVGDAPFGLVDKDATFARWDTRKIRRRHMGPETPRISRMATIFEGTSNDDLIDRMQQVHESIAGMEEAEVDRPQLLKNLLIAHPDINDFGVLFSKAAWGKRLYSALHQETYRQNDAGVLWDNFVMGRIHRALGGELGEHPRYDGRVSYQLDTPTDVLRFDPESNASANDGPEFHVRGNKIPKSYGWDTDQRFTVAIQNVTAVNVYERDGALEVIKDMGENSLRLSYRQQIVGSYHQIETELVVKPQR